MNYLIFYFRINFLFLYLFKLFEHSEHMIIYKIESFWNFTNSKFLKFSPLEILEFSKLRIFGISQMISYFSDS